VEEDVSLDPPDVGILCPAAVLAGADGLANLVKELGLRGRRCGRGEDGRVPPVGTLMRRALNDPRSSRMFHAVLLSKRKLRL
jgi:hypothetical protein